MSRTKRRPRRRRRVDKAVGAPPGTLVTSSDAEKTHVEVIFYGPDKIEEHVDIGLDEIAAARERWPVVWVNVAGLANVELIEQLGARFDLHRLALEDVLSLRQRPKAEAYKAHLFLIARGYRGDGSQGSEQLSVFVAEGLVVSFQERPGGHFDPVRARLRTSGAKLRERGADYLAYGLVDAVVDSYFPLLEQFSERLETLEDAVLAAQAPDVVRDVRGLKRELLGMRRALWPLRDALTAMMRQDGELIEERTRLYLRDTQDHVVQLVDMLETYRELAGSLLDIYLTTISNRTGEVSKVLTLVATIFIPLSFIAGLYGMNFEGKHPLNMPELRWRYGYVAVLGLMAAVVVGMLLFFRRKGWLGTPAARPRERDERASGAPGKDAER